MRLALTVLVILIACASVIQQLQPHEAQAAARQQPAQPAVSQPVASQNQAAPTIGVLEKATTDPIAWLTLAIVGLTVLQLFIHRAQLRANKVMERAYVDISHSTDDSPGLQFSEDCRTATLTIKVKNHGRTPATVTDVYLSLLVSADPLPNDPPYTSGPREPIAAFLMASECFYQPIDLPFSEQDERKFRIDGARIWLIGYVDYQDQFDVLHRSGYARFFEPKDDSGNNLHFETKTGYNYDREIRTFRRFLGSMFG
jgi:hypothetical protein